MKVNLTNETTHQFKQTKVGFSWTTFFFGFWPALFRGDWKWFLIQLAVEIVMGVWSFGIGSGVVGIIFSFFYNKLYINDLIAKGYKPSDKSSSDALLAKGFTVKG